MKRQLTLAAIVLSGGLAFAVPAEAADSNAGATTTSIKVTETENVVTATTIVSGPADDADDDDDDSKAGLWGLLGLLGLAGLAGLARKKRDDDRSGTRMTGVNADTTARGSSTRP